MSERRVSEIVSHGYGFCKILIKYYLLACYSIKFSHFFFIRQVLYLIIIKNIFELRYLENRGAAFGVLQNQKIFFVIIASVMSIVVLYILSKCPADKKYIAFKICLLLIGAGAVGNLIDRLARNFVVDFFYFILIDFPIFNVADIFIVVGIIGLAIRYIYASIKNKDLYSIAPLIDKMETDDVFARKVLVSFARPVVNKAVVAVNRFGSVDFIQSNEQTNALSQIYFNLLFCQISFFNISFNKFL